MKVNTKYQFLLWTQYEYEDKLGCPKLEYNFHTKNEAIKEYNKHNTYLCKMVMEYETADPAADGYILAENWNE